MTSPHVDALALIYQHNLLKNKKIKKIWTRLHSSAQGRKEKKPVADSLNLYKSRQISPKYAAGYFISSPTQLQKVFSAKRKEKNKKTQQIFSGVFNGFLNIYLFLSRI